MAVPFNNKGIAEENGAETKPIVVITGSTRGLGFALTAEFLLRNCRVMISGRSGAGVERALPLLIKRSAQAFGGADFDAGTRLRGRPCDVTEAEQVQALWDAAAEHWGGVDVWINNAGIPQDYLPVRELNPAQVRRILETNLLGVIWGSRIAMRGMEEQGGGQIYNLEGWGSDGKRRIVNILGDHPETVARYLVRKILSNGRNHAHFVWLTGAKVMSRFLTAPFRKGDLFTDY